MDGPLINALAVQDLMLFRRRDGELRAASWRLLAAVRLGRRQPSVSLTCI